MNIPSLFTISGIKAAWAQLLVAPLGVQLGVAVAGGALVGLISYGIYKAYKKRYPSPSSNTTTDSHILKEDVNSKAIVKKKSQGWLSKWWNRSQVIEAVGSNVEKLHRQGVQNTVAIEGLNTKVEKLEALLNTKNSELERQMALNKESSDTEFTNLNQKLDSSKAEIDGQLNTLDGSLKGVETTLKATTSRAQILENKTKTLESKVRVYGSAKKALNDAQKAAFKLEKAAFKCRQAFDEPGSEEAPIAANEQSIPVLAAQATAPAAEPAQSFSISSPKGSIADGYTSSIDGEESLESPRRLSIN